jgi:hypothetical protein
MYRGLRFAKIFRSSIISSFFCWGLILIHGKGKTLEERKARFT